MSIITPNIDSSPYVGVRNVQGKVRVKTHNDAPWLDNFFNGKENCDQTIYTIYFAMMNISTFQLKAHHHKNMTTYY